MLAVVVKNFILMLLIIMILHFMIKNYEADIIGAKHNKNKSSKLSKCNKSLSFNSGNMSIDKKPAKTDYNDKLQKNNISSLSTNLDTPSPSDSSSVQKNESNESNQSNEDIESDKNFMEQRGSIEELYNFVFNENEDSSDTNLNNYFEEHKLTDEKLEKGCDVLCHEQPKDTAVKNFCTNSIDAVLEQQKNSNKLVKEHKTTGILGTDTMKTQQGYQILYEYKNDSDVTPDNLMGFETFESNYFTL